MSILDVTRIYAGNNHVHIEGLQPQMALTVFEVDELIGYLVSARDLAGRGETACTPRPAERS